MNYLNTPQKSVDRDCKAKASVFVQLQGMDSNVTFVCHHYCDNVAPSIN